MDNDENCYKLKYIYRLKSLQWRIEKQHVLNATNWIIYSIIQKPHLSLFFWRPLRSHRWEIEQHNAIPWLKQDLLWRRRKDVNLHHLQSHPSLLYLPQFSSKCCSYTEYINSSTHSIKSLHPKTIKDVTRKKTIRLKKKRTKWVSPHPKHSIRLTVI